MSIERELEHTAEGEAGMLATLSEEQQNLVQMQQVSELTVEPGVMRLPVTQVTTTPDNGRWSIRVEHPIEGELFFNMDKPRTWRDDAELVELLHWYDIQDRDVYKLQTKYLHVEHVGSSADSPHGWELIEPPWMEKRREARRRRRPWHQRAWDRVTTTFAAHRPERTYANVWTALLFGALLPVALLPFFGLTGPQIAIYAGAVVTSFFVTTGAVVAAVEPPEDDGGGR